MELVILIGGFLGAWLLVAGSVYQAALELRDQDFAADRIRAANEQATKLRHPSAWWWLLPPVKLVLERKRDRLFRNEFFSLLSRDDSESMLSFMNKATAWLYVGLGGFLLAAKETYELDQHLHIATGYFFLMVFVLLALSVYNTAARIRRSEKILRSKE